MKSLFKLGTRRSLLAWAQSQWVAREVERLNPGIRIELVGIETRGDQIQDVSLRNIEGKEFFVAEIDAALSKGEVDFTVHSMKDLSLDRPSEFVRAAIPVRENPRDVILFGPHVHEHLQRGIRLKIGTSSPRRIENIPNFLHRALPRFKHAPTLDFIEIRGNVNTRLSRVHHAVESALYLDAVVLAFAGLQRLWQDESGQKELSRLLQGVRWMVLPLRECPAAPAQGALAIECRTNDSQVIEILKKIHHPESLRQVQMERQILADWGGGCHQRFGATVTCQENLGDLLWIRGAKPSGEFVDELRWEAPPKQVLSGDLKPWDGSLVKGAYVELNPPAAQPSAAYFVAHSRAATPDLTEQLRTSRVWTSGTSSWFRLAEKGIWVEGCSEGLGFEPLLETLEKRVLQLPQLKEWAVLTHSDAIDEWTTRGISAISSYKINLNYGDQTCSKIREATHVYWSSGSQWEQLKQYVRPQAHQACGPGKTAARLRNAGLNPDLFPSVEEWRKWLKIS